MQSQPIPVTDVNVFLYTPGVPVFGTTPAIGGASGTYSVGTLTTHVFYNLDLSGGKVNYPVKKGATYYALATGPDGKSISIHWMYCLTDGSSPTFGLTTSLSLPQVHAAPAAGLDAGFYIDIAECKDFRTMINFKPPAIGTEEIPLGDSGWLIGTRVGTPHLMGFRIDKSTRPHFFARGQKGIAVYATGVESGKTISYPNLTCEQADAEATILLQTFP